MKKTISMIMALSLLISTTIFAAEIKPSGLVAEEKLNANRAQSITVSVDEINRIVGDFTSSPKICSDEQANKSDAMLNRLSMLYLSLEQLEKEANSDSNNSDLSMQILFVKDEINSLETEITDSGAIELSPYQVDMMFNGSKSRSVGAVKPSDTNNTRYYLYGPYSTNTNEGTCQYYYVTATALSANSTMWSSHFIPMNDDKISTYVNAVVDVYVGKAIGAVIGSLKWWTEFIPWELFSNPPTSHYNTKATYTITAQYVTNVKFVWCYSPTYDEYSLSVVLNSTNVREVHDAAYVYNGKNYGDTSEKNYTLNCDNYNDVTGIVREFWEGDEGIHIEYIKQIKYNFNGEKVTSITPKHAQGYYSMN